MTLTPRLGVAGCMRVGMCGYVWVCVWVRLTLSCNHARCDRLALSEQHQDVCDRMTDWPNIGLDFHQIALIWDFLRTVFCSFWLNHLNQIEQIIWTFLKPAFCSFWLEQNWTNLGLFNISFLFLFGSVSQY